MIDSYTQIYFKYKEQAKRFNAKRKMPSAFTRFLLTTIVSLYIVRIANISRHDNYVLALGDELHEGVFTSDSGVASKSGRGSKEVTDFFIEKPEKPPPSSSAAPDASTSSHGQQKSFLIKELERVIVEQDIENVHKLAQEGNSKKQHQLIMMRRRKRESKQMLLSKINSNLNSNSNLNLNLNINLNRPVRDEENIGLELEKEKEKENKDVKDNNNSNNVVKCRVEKDLYLEFEEYKHYTCASCYNNLPKHLFKTKLNFNKADRVWLYDDKAQRYLLPNETQSILTTFKTESTFNKWLQCCQQALDCCIQNQIYMTKQAKTTQLVNEKRNNHDKYFLTTLILDPPDRDFCPATWDGLGCWPDTKANSIAQHHCPDHVYFLEFVPVCKGVVTKQCFANGSWFIRNGHEWSDYSNCAPLTIYATRMLTGAIWHIISALIIGPALMLLSKLPNRGGSKRVKILQNLMFWLLLNSILAAAHKMGVLGGIFHPGSSPQDDPPVSQRNNNSYSSNSNLQYSPHQSSLLNDQPVPMTATTTTISTSNPTIKQPLKRELSIWNQQEQRNQLQQRQTNESDFEYYKMLTSDARNQTERTLKRQRQKQQLFNRIHSRIRDKDGNHSGSGHKRKRDIHLKKKKKETNIRYASRLNNREQYTDSYQDNYPLTLFTNNSLKAHIPSSSALSSHQHQSQSQPHQNQTNIVQQQQPSELKDLSREKKSRCKRNASSYQFPKANQPAPAIMFICWMLSLGLRLTRMLGYSWMFTGAVYLCSVLHFAPAEPPALFIKWLMILTDAFPLTIGMIYVIARTLYEPSPLNIIVKLPYYFIVGDQEHIDHLWATQLSCWMFSSNFSEVELIVDFPNFVLVCLNGGLFIVTLIIMCRISRPGCTRNEMSLGDYFKAAGTLVVLYGAHYTLLAYRPNVEGCIQGQVIYYAFLFVDGIQGISVSYVFCYRTQEGREIISKYWYNFRSRGPSWCKPKSKISNEHGLMNCENNKFNQSTRSNNSASNVREATTELFDLDGSPEVEF